MKEQSNRTETVRTLQKEVMDMQGIGKPHLNAAISSLGSIQTAFPNQVFPINAVHEFISNNLEDSAATNGFITGLYSQLITKGTCLWISTRRTIYPAALKGYNVNPENVIFIDLARHRDALWTIEEALKCNAISGVIGEISELSFTESRRLQLAVEKSNVTGFIHRYRPRSENTVACNTRWKITSIKSETYDLPGMGFPRWHVQLLKVRNGKPNSWQIEWTRKGFRYIDQPLFTISQSQQNKIA